MSPGAHVLLVEDDGPGVAALKLLVEAQGHSVRHASTCARALQASRGWVDVALVDLELPDGPGTALGAQLKEANPDSEVILLSEPASVEAAAAAVRAGLWAYLVKPVAAPDLLATLEKAVRQVRAQAERRVLQRRAMEAEKLAVVGTLTAGLSHEIRNPLNAASLQLAVLERRLRKLDDATRGPLLEPVMLVQDEIRRLEHILQDFLQFARPTRLDLRPTPLGPILEKVVAFLITDAERRQVSLSLADADAPVVLGDDSQLRQVFMNLTLNALDAAPSGGQVRIEVEAAPPGRDEVVVHFDDSGEGVPPELVHRVFEPFFTTKALGSGLGLPITNAIISQHGGHVAVGRGPLGGARFSVSLPVTRRG